MAYGILMPGNRLVAVAPPGERSLDACHQVFPPDRLLDEVGGAGFIASTAIATSLLPVIMEWREGDHHRLAVFCSNASPLIPGR